MERIVDTKLEKQLHDLLTVEEVYELVDIVSMKKILSEREKQLKQKLYKNMKTMKKQEVKCDLFSAKIRLQTTRLGVDKDRLKQDGLFEKYSKTTIVKEGVIVTY